MKINETKKRSLLKATSHRVIEVGIDTLILSFFVHEAVAFGLAIMLETLCWGAGYVVERVWNKTDYGREIVR